MIKYAESKKCHTLHEFTEKSCLEPNKSHLTTILDKDTFIQKRIKEGDTMEQALAEWEIVERNRKKAEKGGK